MNVCVMRIIIIDGGVVVVLVRVAGMVKSASLVVGVVMGLSLRLLAADVCSKFVINAVPIYVVGTVVVLHSVASACCFCLIRRAAFFCPCVRATSLALRERVVPRLMV